MYQKNKKTKKSQNVKNPKKHTQPKNTKRIQRGRKINKCKTLKIFSVNAASLKPKVKSLKSHIETLNLAIFAIQETHSTNKGQYDGEFDNHIIFEAIRKSKMKGGTLIGVHKSLKPVLIREYSEEFELLVIEIMINNKQIRIISGYGPQETWPEPQRSPFFVALDSEFEKATIAGVEIISAMDANTKLGKEWIPKDKHSPCENERLLVPIIKRHCLTVGNGHMKAKGVITRKRVLTNRTDESTIDLVLLSNQLAGYIKEIIIDEEQDYGLCRITKTRTGTEVKQSDHNPIITELEIPWSNKTKGEKIEIPNYKNKECQKKFKKLTSEGTYLSSAFEGEESLSEKTDKFLKRLDKVCRQTFRKIRIKKTRDKHLNKLFTKWNNLRKKTDEKHKKECREIEDILADEYAKEYMGKIEDATKNINTNEGGYNSGNLWKLKKQIFPQCRDSPTAMFDQEGVLQTESSKIIEATESAYKFRMRNRPIKQGLEDVKTDKEKLCEARIKIAQENKTKDWTLDELEVVLEHLKRDASRDPLGYANELFKPEVAGNDLKKSILILMNQIKKEQIIPEKLKLCNISSIWKRKLSKHEFESYRGIFRVTVLRNILDLLIYKDEFPNLDKQISDCNVGGRSGRNVRDNIFVLNAILNSISKRSKEAHDLQVYDAEKCFDSLWLQECINSLFEANFKNDKLSLLYLLNSHAQVAIKTSSGMTKRIDMFNIIMQGTVWGTTFCVMIMNKLIRLVEKSPNLLYLYNGKVPVPPLQMVDDVLGIQKCGATSVALNSTVNSFFEAEKLTLSKSKSHVIHVGENVENCCQLKVHDENMDLAESEKYLGDVINKSGKPRQNILARKAKGYGIVSQIVAITEEAPLGRWRMKCSMILRNAMLVNSMLFNAEAWQGIVKDDIQQLTRVDESLFRKIFSAHSKTPIEAFCLESGQIPLQFIWTSRRILYLQTILKRDTTETTRNVYEAQKENIKKGDFVQLIEEDAKLIDMNINETEIRGMTKYEFKKIVKEKVYNAAFRYLKTLQQTHTKIKHIKYDHLKMQPYMQDKDMDADDISLLFALRTKCVRGIRTDFSGMFPNTRCPLCSTHEDSLSALLMCEDLKHIPRNGYKYSDVFSCSVQEQRLAMVQHRSLIKERERILEQRAVADAEA